MQTICRVADVIGAVGPLVVPNADLLRDEEAGALRAYDRGPVVLLGRAAGSGELTCIVLQTGHEVARVQLPAERCWEPRDARPPLAFSDRPGYEAVPEGFWAAAASVILDAIDAWGQAEGAVRCRADDLDSGLRLMTMQDARGLLRIALVSTIATYLVPTTACHPRRYR